MNKQITSNQAVVTPEMEDFIVGLNVLVTLLSPHGNLLILVSLTLVHRQLHCRPFFPGAMKKKLFRG